VFSEAERNLVPGYYRDNRAKTLIVKYFTINGCPGGAPLANSIKVYVSEDHNWGKYSQFQ